MPERINGGQALVVVAAIGLIVSLFLDWYAPGVSAWTAFEIVDLLLVVSLKPRANGSPRRGRSRPR